MLYLRIYSELALGKNESLVVGPFQTEIRLHDFSSDFLKKIKELRDTCKLSEFACNPEQKVIDFSLEQFESAEELNSSVSGWEAEAVVVLLRSYVARRVKSQAA